jgi:hypothetical protein
MSGNAFVGDQVLLDVGFDAAHLMRYATLLATLISER